MSKIYKGVSELIGKTPIIEAVNFEKAVEADATILAKLEYFNPAGSVKDRVALAMIEEAEKKGVLKKGATIIEPTSGNTGIGLAAVGVSKGYKVILTMPETMSIERRNLLKAYGAQIVLTEGAKGMTGAIKKADELKGEIENSVILGQFVNPANPAAHFATTGPEIWEDTDGKVDIFIAGVGTGGTVTGVGQYLKSKNPDVKIVAVEQLHLFFHRANQVHTKFRVSAQASFLMSLIQRFMTRSYLSRMRTLSRQATSSLKQRVSSLVSPQVQHLKPLRYFQRDLRTRARLSLHFSLIQVRDIFQQHFSRANFSNIQNRKRADSQAS